MRTRKSLRVRYLAAFLILFTIEALIAVFVRDRFVRPYVGDVLVVLLVYCAVRIIEPEKWPYLPAAVFAFAAAVEICQYFRLDRILGLDDIRAVRLILGATFDWKDLVCYAVGCAVLGVWERSWRRAYLQ